MIKCKEGYPINLRPIQDKSLEDFLQERLDKSCAVQCENCHGGCLYNRCGRTAVVERLRDQVKEIIDTAFVLH